MKWTLFPQFDKLKLIFDYNMFIMKLHFNNTKHT